MLYSPDTFANLLKTSRIGANITVESLSEKTGIPAQRLYRIENERKEPSFDELYLLIRELNIPSEEIFYPNKPHNDSEIAELLQILSEHDKRSLKVIEALARALQSAQSNAEDM